MKSKPSKNVLLLFSLLVAILIMGIGYASINSITGEIQGKLIANVQDGVFITNVEYVDGVDADLNTSEIKKYVGTLMQSTVKLSGTNPSSEITYKVTVYNNSNVSSAFLGVLHDGSEPDFYDNPNIIFEIKDTGFKVGDVINAHETKDIYITFKYKDGTIPENTVLNSYLNFKFVPDTAIKRLKRTILKQIDSTMTGEDNVGDGINFVMNVNDAFNGFLGILDRINVLLSSYDDYSEIDREPIKFEISGLIIEFDNIANNANLNGSMNEQNPYIIEYGNDKFEQGRMEIVLPNYTWGNLYGSEEIDYNDVDGVVTKTIQVMEKIQGENYDITVKVNTLKLVSTYLYNMEQSAYGLYKYIFFGDGDVEITEEESTRRSKSWGTTQYLCNAGIMECDSINNILLRIDSLLDRSSSTIEGGNPTEPLKQETDDVIAELQRQLQNYQVGYIKLFDGSFPCIEKTDIDTLNIRNILMSTPEEIAESKAKIANAKTEINNIMTTLINKYDELEPIKDQEADEGYAFELK